jgi:hypothetical protein
MKLFCKHKNSRKEIGYYEVFKEISSYSIFFYELRYCNDCHELFTREISSKDFYDYSELPSLIEIGKQYGYPLSRLQLELSLKLKLK